MDQDRLQRRDSVVEELDYSVCWATDISLTNLAYVPTVDEEPNDQRVNTLGAAAVTHNTEPSVNYALAEVLQCQCKQFDVVCTVHHHTICI